MGGAISTNIRDIQQTFNETIDQECDVSTNCTQKMKNIEIDFDKGGNGYLCRGAKVKIEQKAKCAADCKIESLTKSFVENLSEDTLKAAAEGIGLAADTDISVIKTKFNHHLTQKCSGDVSIYQEMENFKIPYSRPELCNPFTPGDRPEVIIKQIANAKANCVLANALETVDKTNQKVYLDSKAKWDPIKSFAMAFVLPIVGVIVGLIVIIILLRMLGGGGGGGGGSAPTSAPAPSSNGGGGSKVNISPDDIKTVKALVKELK